MSDLISKAALFNSIANCHDKAEIFAMIQSAPTVDAVPVVHGRWIPHVVDARKGTMSIDEDVCSVCGKDFLQIRETGCVWNYCPNCGAKMDGERKSE